MNIYKEEIERLTACLSKEDAAKCRADTLEEVAHNVVNVAIMALNQKYINQSRKTREDEITQKTKALVRSMPECTCKGSKQDIERYGHMRRCPVTGP